MGKVRGGAGIWGCGGVGSWGVVVRIGDPGAAMPVKNQIQERPAPQSGPSQEDPDQVRWIDCAGTASGLRAGSGMAEPVLRPSAITDSPAEGLVRSAGSAIPDNGALRSMPPQLRGLPPVRPCRLPVFLFTSGQSVNRLSGLAPSRTGSPSAALAGQPARQIHRFVVTHVARGA